jgi:hypothetical protein
MGGYRAADVAAFGAAYAAEIGSFNAPTTIKIISYISISY